MVRATSPAVGGRGVSAAAAWEGEGWKDCSVREKYKDPINSAARILAITSEVLLKPACGRVGMVILDWNTLCMETRNRSHTLPLLTCSA